MANLCFKGKLKMNQIKYYRIYPDYNDLTMNQIFNNALSINKKSLLDKVLMLFV